MSRSLKQNVYSSYPRTVKSSETVRKDFSFSRILFKKVVIMHGKGEFATIKGSICNVPIEKSNICKVLPRPLDSNGLILVKLKRHLICPVT